MPRVIEDGGSVATILKPLRLPVYEPGRLPDPVTCAGAIIIINDRRDGNPRPSLAVSNGASWDVYARVDQAQQVTQIVQSPTTVDVTPLVVTAVRDMLPELVSRATQQALPAPMATSDPAPFAQAILDMAEHMHAMQSRLDYIEQNALGRVVVEGQ